MAGSFIDIELPLEVPILVVVVVMLVAVDGRPERISMWNDVVIVCVVLAAALVSGRPAVLPVLVAMVW